MIASGRDADVFDIGEGKVLRRYRRGGPTLREAAVMGHAAMRGYPVPRVHFVDDSDLILDRLDGPTMRADLERRPWRVFDHARTLAELHERLHAIAAPPDLDAPFGEGRSLLHLDLHPGNVLLTAEGPFVIDWRNAARGPGPADIADLWVVSTAVGATGGLPGRALRALFVRAFLARFGVAAIEPYLPAAAGRRLADPNLHEPERRAIRRFLAGRGV